MIGRQLGGRYEILERIGGGGMALVYKAHDILLNRFVAVKVLRQQYVNDEEFIRRFRREAQSAASLSHPNIVSIYDVGQEQETHYIVMEYIEGVTLNDVIKDKAPLQVEEAIHFATQICDALDHAHMNHIIHRDIKPHNILIGKNGRVKVTDFGIARATSASTITQTGSVVGSVHYFSPEHAKGTNTGAKSDLYSLGIVLYQMLTAQLPFIGESPISVALKHLQETMVEPRKVNPLIPQSVENIILKAVRKNQDERYQSAKEMLSDLDSSLSVARRNEPKLLFLHDDEHDNEKTRVIPAIRSNQYVTNAKPDDGDEDEDEPRKNYWIAPLVWLLIFAVTISILWFGLLPLIKNNGAPKDVEVPTVVGKNVKDAETLLTNAKLKFVETYQEDEKIAKDIVIRQNPSGMKVKEGATISLIVSNGFEKPKAANYVGRKIQDVIAELTDAGIDENTQIQVIRKFLPDEKDTIVMQDPKPDEPYDPAKVKYTFTVSGGSEKIAMPDLTGHTLEEVKSILLLNNLSLASGDAGVIMKPSFAQPKDRVFDQFPFKPGDDVDQQQDNIVVYISTGNPEDAGEMTITTVLKPVKVGTPSTFRISLKDAKNDNDNYKTFQKSQDYIDTLNVTVTKDTDAVVTYYRDNAFYSKQTFTYQKYLDQSTQPTPSPSTLPVISAAPNNSAAPTPTPTPTPTPPVVGG